MSHEVKEVEGTLDYAVGGPERSIMRQLVGLAIPSIISSISVTLMHFTNNWMISWLDRTLPEGERVNLAAALNGGMSAWVFIFAAMGVGTAVSTLASQSLGKGNKTDCGGYAWQGLWVALISIVVFWPLTLLGPVLFTWLKHDPALVPVEASYFQIVAGAAPILLAQAVMSNFFLGVHRPINQMVAGIAGNVVDAVLCYGLLFGRFGLPAMGVTGAAWSAAAGAMTSFLVMFFVFLSPRVGNELGAYRHKRPTWTRMWQLLRLGIPAGVQQGSDLMTWAIFSVAIIGGFGVIYSSAQGTVMNCLMLSFMPAIGVGNAVNAMVGRKVGEKRFDLADASAMAGLKLTMSYMGVCGLLFFVFRYELAGVFLQEPAQSVAATLLIFTAVFQLSDAINVVFISALRGAGDVRQPTMVLMALAWGVCVGGGILVARYLPGLKAVGPWGAATLYIMLMTVYLVWRWRSGGWQKLDVFRGTESPKGFPVSVDSASETGAHAKA
jgi:MATE family multidrug resistance protein